MHESRGDDGASTVSGVGRGLRERERPVVLVVDDDEDLADTYAAWLSDEYEVHTAYSGAAAQQKLRDGLEADVVLLDRRMLGITGDEVLDYIQERGRDCKVSMLTAVAPDIDIVDLPFDEYLVKPVTRSAIVDAVDELLLRESFDEETQEYLALDTTERLLSERDAPHIRDSDALAELRERIDEVGEDEALREQVAELERLKRLNTLIRNTSKMLVKSEAREVLVQRICEVLVENDTYRYAVFADYTAAHAELDVRATRPADADAPDVDGVDAPDDGPVSAAIGSGEVGVVDCTGGDASATGDGGEAEGPVARLVASDVDATACAVVPVTYHETQYGVLLVYTASAEGVSERERAVLGELGNSIAHAISTVESKQLLFADTAVELEFRVEDRSDAFVDLSAELGCRLTLEGVASPVDGGVTCYVIVSGAVEDVSEYFATAPGVAHYHGIEATEEGHLFEVTLTGSAVVRTLLHASASVQRLFAEGGTAEVTVEVSQGVDVRTVTSALERAFPETTLVKKRSTDHSIQSEGAFRAGAEERLTDKQEAAVRAAYDSGYFAWPREETGEEIADSMGLASSTFQEHLRHGLGKLVGLYLDAENPEAD